MAKNKKGVQPSNITPLGQAEMKINGSKALWRGLLIQVLIALTGLWGLIGSFVSMFALPVKTGSLYVASAFFLVLFGVAFYKKSVSKWALPLLGALYAAVLWLFKIEIICGYKIVTTFVCKAINNNTDLQLPIFELKGIRNYEYYVGVFLALALFLIACGVAFSVLHRPNIFVLFLVTFPWVEIGLLFGLEPSLRPTVMLFSCWGAVAAIQIAAHRKKGKGASSSAVRRANAAGIGAVTLLLTMAVAWCGTVFFPPEKYSHENTIEKFSSDLELVVDGIKNPQKVIGGGVNGGRLGDADKISYTYEKALELDMFSQKSALYLKGYVGGVYTGNSWDQIPESEYRKYRKNHDDIFTGPEANIKLQNLPVTYQELNTQRMGDSAQQCYEDIIIRNIAANPQYIYTPYSVDYNIPNLSTYYDACAFPAGGEREFNFTLHGKDIYDENKILNDLYSLEQAEFAPVGYDYDARVDFLQMERNYRIFVRDVYTALPKQGNERLASEAAKLFKNKNLSKSVIVETVREYLKKYADYNLEAGRLPAGEDFVDWFLYENHKGSCTHFASAAVLMFRYAGVPARYVEGYIVTNDDFKKGTSLGVDKITLQQGSNIVPKNEEKRRVDVLDSNAHAWVEIYIDGYGWLPIEVTPGFSVQGINIPQTGETISRSIPVITKPEKPTKPIKTTTVTTTQSTTKAAASNHQGDNTSGGFQVKKLLSLLLLLTGLAVLFCACVGVRHMFVMQQRKRSMCSDKRESILFIYAQILLLLGYLGLKNENNASPLEYAKLLDSSSSEKLPEPFEPVTALVMRAQFSPAQVTPDEKTAVLNYLKALSRKNYKTLPKLQKLLFRYYNNLYW